MSGSYGQFLVSNRMLGAYLQTRSETHKNYIHLAYYILYTSVKTFSLIELHAALVKK